MYSFGVYASGISDNLIYKQGVDPVSLEQALLQVKPGDVVVLGEEHGSLEQAAQQVQVLEMLRKNGLKVSVGMEFFDFQTQGLVDQYRSGVLNENDFLTQIKWGVGFSFDAYRQQVLFPNGNEGTVIALNAPRSLTGRISKVGISGLTAEEKALLPPTWALGNDQYFERFSALMGGGHIPAEAVNRYFEAQSTWDDTMASQAGQYIKANPSNVLVIIVGEFHVQYGGGLPDRLKVHGMNPLTFSLVNLNGMSSEDVDSEVLPNSKYGSRADFVWTSNFSRP